MLAQRGALHLELIGMKRKGRSVYSIVKQMYGIKGTKATVLQRFEDLIEKEQGFNLEKRYTARANEQVTGV
jgi:hypothetical protein